MKDQIVEAINWYKSNSDGKITSPSTLAAKHLFMSDDNMEALDDGWKQAFHSIVAKLLYVAKRARPDIEPTIAFLCTCVSCSNMDDWKKLGRVIGFLNKTIDDKRVIGVTSLKTLVTWVDAAYAVYRNMRSQMGGMSSFGLGAIQTKSSKQKINAKKSTKADLIGVGEVLPYNI